MKESKYVLIIDNDYGMDVYLFNNPNFADETLENFVYSYWNKQFPDLPFDDIDDPVQYYFDRVQYEYAYIFPVTALDEPEVFDAYL